MKIHFAGLEQIESSVILNKVSGINYALFTVFPFICKQFKIGSSRKNGKEVTKYLTDNFNHTIMDSGLFTLMFGAHAGKRDRDFVTAWQHAIINFVRETKYTGTVVEVDCQKILGVDSAWEFRKKLRKELPNNQQMNVFHIEDGKEGLIKMAKWSKYIALSIPEFRALGWKNIPLKVTQLCNIIKNENPDIKIHLLGCTQKNILEKTKFCYSSDSTSWMQVNRWGSQIVFNNGKYEKVKRKTVVEQSKILKNKIRKVLTEEKIKVPANLEGWANTAMSGIYLKQMYSKYAGSQE